MFDELVDQIIKNIKEGQNKDQLKQKGKRLKKQKTKKEKKK